MPTKKAGTTETIVIEMRHSTDIERTPEKSIDGKLIEDLFGILSTARIGTVIMFRHFYPGTPPVEEQLIVALGRWDATTAAAFVTDKTFMSAVATATPFDEVLLTSDGRIAFPEYWHTGPETGEAIAYERWTADHRTHGFVDPGTRRLVQSG